MPSRSPSWMTALRMKNQPPIRKAIAKTASALTNFFAGSGMNHQREEQQNAAQQVRVGVIVRQRAESAACSHGRYSLFAECAFHAANPEIDDQCDRENGERVVVYIAGEEHELRQETDENYRQAVPIRGVQRALLRSERQRSVCRCRKGRW